MYYIGNDVSDKPTGAGGLLVVTFSTNGGQGSGLYVPYAQATEIYTVLVFWGEWSFYRK